MQPVIAQSTIFTAYGQGAGACWDALMCGRSAVRQAPQFAREEFISQKAAVITDLPGTGRSRVMNLLTPTLDRMTPHIPGDAALLLATTTGEIDLLERGIIGNDPQLIKDSHPLNLLGMVKKRIGLSGPAEVVSSACASSSAALTRAAGMIEAGRCTSAVVIGCDALSEFVFAGFSTLMALSPQPARPFDRSRDGLNPGEAVALALVMDPERAKEENRPITARIRGWALGSDANHMTGPSRDGEGLARTIKKALLKAGTPAGDVTSICAHGTGTAYNDAMEMKAFKTVFANKYRPVYSIKGGVGHTMGAAGLVETLIAAESIKKDAVPPTTGLTEPDTDAAGWVSAENVKLSYNDTALSTNSGFGGTNSAIILGGV